MDTAPIFGQCLLWPNGWIDQDAIGREVGLGPGEIVLDGDPAPLHKKKGGDSSPPTSQPMSIVAKRLMDQDVT